MALPSWLDPYAQSFITAYGQQVFGQGWQPGQQGTPTGLPANVQQQVAPFSPYQQQALQQTGQITPDAQGLAYTAANQVGATSGGNYLGLGNPQPLQDIGNYQTGSTMAGGYLSPENNPYLRGTFNSAASDVINAYQTAVAPGTTAAAQRAGQFGSSAMNEQGQLNQYALGQNLNNLAAGIYGPAYQQERGIQAGTVNQNQQLTAQAFQNERQRQIQAASMAPQTTANLYAPANTLFGAGAAQQGQQQNVLDTGYANAVANYEAPYNQLSGLGGATLQAGGGGETTTTTKVKGGGGGSVVCTVLHDKGLTDDETYEAAGEFGRRQTQEMRSGYRSWAVPLARAMDKSPFLMLMLKPFWTAWQREMKARVKGGKGSVLGKILLAVGMPFSEWIGRRRNVRSQTIQA